VIDRVILFRGVSFRFEGVDHRPISEFTSDAHGYLVIAGFNPATHVFLHEIPGSRDARPGMVE
jgi:hypothetical protein